MLLVLAGCVGVPPVPSPRPAPVFDPFAFFVGASVGHASLRRLFAGDEPILVHSHGRIVGGALLLDQVIDEPGKPPRARRWQLRQTGPGHYAGSLSDAAGPVTGEVAGNRLHLAFTMKGGFAAQQYLALSADGGSADNILIVRKFGLPVAVLTERIARLP